MKKYVLLLFSIVMAVSLLSCSSKETADTIVLPEIEYINSISVENNDGSFSCTDMEQITKNCICPKGHGTDFKIQCE